MNKLLLNRRKKEFTKKNKFLDKELESFFESKNTLIKDDEYYQLNCRHENEDNKINIVISGDNKISFSIVVLIKSIILNCKNYQKLQFWLVTEESNNIKEIYDLLLKNINYKDEIKLNFIFPNKDLIDEVKNRMSMHVLNIENKPFSVFNFIRFKFDKLLPETVNKCIYLDNDMIVKSDIEDLFNSLDNKHDLAAVYPVKPYKLTKTKWLFSDILKKNYSKDKLWNAGMYVFYLKCWKEKNYGDLSFQLMDINSKERIYEGGTQAVMNIVCEKVKSLDCLWNLTGLSENNNWDNEFDQLVKKAKLLHYTGHKKPWLDYQIKSDYLKEWYIYLKDVDRDIIKSLDKVIDKNLDIVNIN